MLKALRAKGISAKGELWEALAFPGKGKVHRSKKGAGRRGKMQVSKTCGEKKNILRVNPTFPARTYPPPLVPQRVPQAKSATEGERRAESSQMSRELSLISREQPNKPASLIQADLPGKIPWDYLTCLPHPHICRSTFTCYIPPYCLRLLASRPKLITQVAPQHFRDRAASTRGLRCILSPAALQRRHNHTPNKQDPDGFCPFSNTVLLTFLLF